MVTNFCCAMAGAENDVAANSAAAAKLITPVRDFMCMSLRPLSDF
jgi:hypothetical protein